MRTHILFWLLPFFVLASACGSASRGSAVVNKKGSASANAVSGASSVYVDPAAQFGSCVNLSVYVGYYDAAAENMLRGLSACPSLSNTSLVKIKGTPSLPAMETVCVIASSLSSTGQSNCLNINGEANVNTGVADFKYITVLRSSQLNNYWYWDGQSDYYPTMAWGQVR